jgi:uncharacterized protein YajQ (UPF0234 family)
MANDASFDVVSRVNMQEVDNAVNQCRKEIGQRYDFKDSKTELTLKDDELKIVTEDDFKLRSVIDTLQTKLIKRGVSIKNLEYSKVEQASGGMLRQLIKIKQGIETEQARKMVKDIKALGLKVQSQIMEEQVRVSGKNRDDLQKVIGSLKEKDYGVELQFVNYR